MVSSIGRATATFHPTPSIARGDTNRSGPILSALRYMADLVEELGAFARSRAHERYAADDVHEAVAWALRLVGKQHGGKLRIEAGCPRGCTPRWMPWRSSTTIDLRKREERTMRRLPKNRRPTHPGKVFLEDFLMPLGITQKEAADRLRISYPRMNEIIRGKRSVTPDTALRLGRFTNTEPEFWLNLQQAADLWDAMHSDRAGELERIEPAHVA